MMQVRDISLQIRDNEPKEWVIELKSVKNGMIYVEITIDGQIHFTFSNQSFSTQELKEIIELANNAYLIIECSRKMTKE